MSRHLKKIDDHHSSYIRSFLRSVPVLGPQGFARCALTDVNKVSEICELMGNYQFIDLSCVNS